MEFSPWTDEDYHYEICPLCKGHGTICWIISKNPVNTGCEPCPKCNESGKIQIWNAEV